MTGAAPVLSLRGVSLVRGERLILDGVDWDVRPSERWVLLGANGSGKTSLARIASMWLHPSSGEVEVLGGVLGRIDVRRHRTRIALVSAAMADQLRPALTAGDIVVTAKHGALEPWWHTYTDDDRAAALAALDRVGAAWIAGRLFGTLSSGERQRVLLARALFGDAGLLLLDEPMAGLDLAAREDLVARLAGLAAEPATAPMVLVTHHVDEIPPGFTHGLLLRDGKVAASGPLADVLTAERLSETFGLRLVLERRHGRWWSVAAP